MKKLTIIAALILIGFVAFGQNSTIVDYEHHFEIQYDNGDTVATGKGDYSGISVIMENGVKITVVTGQDWTPIRSSGGTGFDFTDFGYGAGRNLFNFLTTLYFHEYIERYTYSGGLMDSAYYIYNTDTLYYNAFGYTDDSLTSKISGTW